MHKPDVRESGKRLQEASRALILLHGRGAAAEDILPLARFFTDGTWYVAAPQATGSRWYPHSFLAPLDENEPWLSSAIEYVRSLVESVTRFLPPENIYMMGFSQGACLSLEVAARFAARYGGIAGFSGGLIGEVPEPDNYSGDFAGTPVYISNGDNDPHIPLSRSEETRDHLEKMGANVLLDIYPGRAHTIIQSEMEKAASHLMIR